MRWTLACLLLLLLPWGASCQLFLQMEKSTNAKTKKFRVGDEITYQLIGEDSWRDAEIIQIVPSDTLVVFNHQFTKIDQIAAFRTYDPQRWSKPLGTNLYLFGAAWSGYSLVASLVDEGDPYSWGDFAVTGSAIATGFLIQQLFKHRTFRFNKKRRLRIVDLRINVN